MHFEKSRQVRVGGESLAICGDMKQNWFIGFSPEYDNLSAEGPWEEWVRLARAILQENDRRSRIAFTNTSPRR